MTDNILTLDCEVCENTGRVEAKAVMDLKPLERMPYLPCEDCHRGTPSFRPRRQDMPAPRNEDPFKAPIYGDREVARRIRLGMILRAVLIFAFVCAGLYFVFVPSGAG